MVKLLGVFTYCASWPAYFGRILNCMGPWFLLLHGSLVHISWFMKRVILPLYKFKLKKKNIFFHLSLVHISWCIKTDDFDFSKFQWKTSFYFSIWASSTFHCAIVWPAPNPAQNSLPTPFSCSHHSQRNIEKQFQKYPAKTSLTLIAHFCPFGIFSPIGDLQYIPSTY